MRRFAVVLWVLISSVLLVPFASAKDEMTYGIPNINVILDGKKLVFPDVWPEMDKQNHVLVPIRVVSESMGAKVSAGATAKDIVIRQGAKTIKLAIGSKNASVDGKAVTLDSPAIVKSGRTLVPLRFVSEALGQSVEWSSVDKYVWIGSKTLHDIEKTVKLEDVKDYAYLYDKISPGFLGKFGREHVQVITNSTLPIYIPYGSDDEDWKKKYSTTIYNISLEKRDGAEFIRIHYSADRGLHIEQLTDDIFVRAHGPRDDMRETLADKSIIDFYPVMSRGDSDAPSWATKWNKVTGKNISYLCFLIDSRHFVFYKPDWK